LGINITLDCAKVIPLKSTTSPDIYFADVRPAVAIRLHCRKAYTFHQSKGDTVHCHKHFRLLALVVLSSPVWGQAPASPSVQRDPSALSLLTQSVAAMTTANARVLSDLVAQGTCTQWNAADENAPVTYSVVRATSSHLEVHLPESTQSWTISGGIGYSRDEKGNTNRMRTANAMQARWYMPALYLIQSLNEAGASVSMAIAGQTADENEDVVVITPPRALGAALLNNYPSPVPRAVHIDRTTHMVTEIDDRLFMTGDLSSSIPHRIHFADYREENGWLMPHSIEEYLGQMRIAAFTFSNFSINSGMTLTLDANTQ
jgi:hypothetical protein